MSGRSYLTFVFPTLILLSLAHGCGVARSQSLGVPEQTNNLQSEIIKAAHSRNDYPASSNQNLLPKFGQGRVVETLLSTCYVDASYKPELVYFSLYSSDQNYTWWNANYQHGYVERRSILVTTFDATGQVVQQITTTRNDPKTSALKSNGYFLGDNGYNGPADRRGAETLMKRMYENEVNARMLMQCAK